MSSPPHPATPLSPPLSISPPSSSNSITTNSASFITSSLGSIKTDSSTSVSFDSHSNQVQQTAPDFGNQFNSNSSFYPTHKSAFKSNHNMSTSTITGINLTGNNLMSGGIGKGPDTPPTSNGSEEDWISSKHFAGGGGGSSGSSGSGKMGGANWDRVIGGERKTTNGIGIGGDWKAYGDAVEGERDSFDGHIRSAYAVTSHNGSLNHTVTSLQNHSDTPVSAAGRSSAGGFNEKMSQPTNSGEDFFFQPKVNRPPPSTGTQSQSYTPTIPQEEKPAHQILGRSPFDQDNMFGDEQPSQQSQVNLNSFSSHRNESRERARNEMSPQEEFVQTQIKREQQFYAQHQQLREREKEAAMRQQGTANANFQSNANAAHGSHPTNGSAYGQLRMEDPSFGSNHFDPLLGPAGASSQAFNAPTSNSADMLYAPSNLEHLQALSLGLVNGAFSPQHQQQQAYNQPLSRQTDNSTLLLQQQIMREREQAALNAYGEPFVSSLKGQMPLQQMSGLSSSDISTLAASAPFGQSLQDRRSLAGLLEQQPQLFGINHRVSAGGAAGASLASHILLSNQQQQQQGQVSFGMGGVSSPSNLSASANGPFLNQNNLQLQHIQAALTVAGQLPGNVNQNVAIPQTVNAHSAAAQANAAQQQEEISTIFVVGFPDDMQEREFQNMFIFAQGFEAATLKIPAAQVAAREKEMHAASVAAAQSGVMVPGKQMDYGFDGYGSQLVDPQNTSAYLTGANSQNMNDAVPSNAAGGASSTTRKQIIGFAKFRTKAEAIIARDMLAARRVDAEKGSVLKAEMAKKNLHTKRGLLNEPIPPAQQSMTNLPANLPPGNSASQQALQSALYFAGQQAMPAQQQSRDVQQLLAMQQRERDVVERERELREREHRDRTNQLQANSSKVFDAFQSVPNQNRQTNSNSQFDTQSLYNETFPSQFSPQSVRYAGNEQVTQGESSATMDRTKRTSSTSPDLTFDRRSNQSPPSSSSAIATSPATRTSIEHQSHFPKSLLQSLHEDEEMPPGLIQSGLYSQDLRNDNSSRFEDNLMGFQDRDLVARMSTMSMNQGSSQSPADTLPSPTSLNSPTFNRSQNPGDNNPPISTLYIGLPSVLPSTSGPQSAQALEDSLRNLFSQCPGYRRLSFRQKANNNICHVEFDSVEHASRTKDALQGNTLGGLVKTGIRISYSKNPLGIRSGSLSNGSVSPGAMSPTGLGPTDLSLASFTATSGQGRRPSESLFSPSDYNHYYNRSRGTMRSPDAGSSTSPPPLSLGNSNFNSFSG